MSGPPVVPPGPPGPPARHRSLARLVFPALRWRSRSGFTHEGRRIAAALEAGVGGFILFGGSAGEISTLTRALRERAGRPLLLGADLERGAAQQVRGLTEMPSAGALGFLNDRDATHTAALITAREALAVGLNWNFAPVCDLDIEPQNPIVQTRSFGSDPAAVGAHAAAFVCGSQEHGVLACAKHFPGHGRTTVDSHQTLPVVTASVDELRAMDVAPFARTIAEGVGSVMTAHVAYPAWASGGTAATFAPEIITYLRDELRFEGLVVTDALIMGGARAAEAEAAATVTAVAAGCDALLYPDNFRAVVAELDAAVGGEIPRARAEEALERCERAAQIWENAAAPLSETDLASHRAFADRLADRALHLVRGERPRLPPPFEVAVIDDDVGGPYPIASRDVFARTLTTAAAAVPAATVRRRVIALYSEPRSWKGRAGLGTQTRRTLERLAGGTELIVLFGHPRLAAGMPPGPAVLCAWHGQALMQRAAARWIAGRPDEGGGGP